MEPYGGFDLHELMWDANNTNYLAVASLALLVYDHLISLREEVDLIWKSHWSVTKGVYLWNRYFALFTLGLNTSIRLREMKTDRVCGTYLQILSVNATLIICTVDFVLMLRVWVLYGRLKAVLYVMIPSIIFEVIVMAYLGSATISGLNPYVHIGPALLGCYSLAIVPKMYNIYPVPPLLVTSVMFSLTAYKCAQTLYGYGRHGMPIVSLFLRDGVFWFLAVLAVGLPHMILSYVARLSLVTVMIGPSLAVYSIVVSRALINVKGIMTSQTGVDGTYDSRVRTNLDFWSDTPSDIPSRSSSQFIREDI
ncbi:hypothetical protein BDZ94DRAFT_1319210 [Collybia nuda]|uniref:DUF6533 domain-containing protein n=1 Tax=Collybia nuda TaxID=64659 RepID=A0A9P6CHQ7_9AGAR|nr:hypothetical protein BDZ94DRAFT_1319210 [Collybia nuda]